MTIEDFDYSTGVVEPITNKHCAKCVSVNKCWFVNEKEKKPEPFPITQVKVIDNVINEIFIGLYHYRCHCQELDIISPCLEDIQLIIPQGKDGWLYRDKQNWIRAFGYINNEEFLSDLCDLIKEAYCNGNYKIIDHTNYGTKINLFLEIKGKGVKEGKTYNIKSAFMIFPNGKLKCNTFIGGWW